MVLVRQSLVFGIVVAVALGVEVGEVLGVAVAVELGLGVDGGVMVGGEAGDPNNFSLIDAQSSIVAINSLWLARNFRRKEPRACTIFVRNFRFVLLGLSISRYLEVEVRCPDDNRRTAPFSLQAYRAFADTRSMAWVPMTFQGAARACAGRKPATTTRLISSLTDRQIGAVRKFMFKPMVSLQLSGQPDPTSFISRELWRL